MQSVSTYEQLIERTRLEIQQYEEELQMEAVKQSVLDQLLRNEEDRSDLSSSENGESSLPNSTETMKEVMVGKESEDEIEELDREMSRIEEFMRNVVEPRATVHDTYHNLPITITPLDFKAQNIEEKESDGRSQYHFKRNNMYLQAHRKYPHLTDTQKNSTPQGTDINLQSLNNTLRTHPKEMTKHTRRTQIKQKTLQLLSSMQPSIEPVPQHSNKNQLHRYLHQIQRNTKQCQKIQSQINRQYYHIHLL